MNASAQKILHAVRAGTRGTLLLSILGFLSACTGFLNLRGSAGTTLAVPELQSLPDRALLTSPADQEINFSFRYSSLGVNDVSTVGLSASAANRALFRTEPVATFVGSESGLATLHMTVLANAVGQSPITVVLKAGEQLVEKTFSLVVAPVTPAGTLSLGRAVVATRSVALSETFGSNTSSALSSCSATPSLPAGLYLGVHLGKCALSGTPTALSPLTTYALAGTTNSGTVKGSLSLVVNDLAPASLNFAASPANLALNQATSTLISTHTGGDIESCALSGNSTALPAGLSLSLSLGECLISGTPTALAILDGYVVTASNAGGASSAIVKIAVSEAAPGAIDFGASGNALTLTQGVAMTTLLATNAAGGGGIASCTSNPALPDGLTLARNGGNPQRCRLSGTPLNLQSATSYVLSASNSAGSVSQTLSITVVTGAPTAPNSLAYGASAYTLTLGVAISPVLTSTHGGGLPTSCAATGLPAGVAVSLSGGECVISGTPTALQSATSATITATNVTGSSAVNVDFTVIDLAPSSLAFAGGPFTFTKSVAITALNSTSSGGAIVSCSGTLPAGLSLALSAGRCVISGTPTAVSAATNYTVTATNTGGSTNATVNITVNDIAPSSLAFAGGPFTFGKSVAITALTSTSSGGAITSCSGTLPAGLSVALTTGNCVISGTPTTVSAATNYTLTATNSGGSTTATVNIAVTDAAPSSLAFAGGPFTFSKSVAITALTSSSSGGVITSCTGTLPTGLSVALGSGNCVISGTPTTVSAATDYTVTATNSGGSSAATVNITVIDAAPTTLAFAGGPFTFAKSTAITALTSTSSGGAITSCSGTLPAGLSVALSSGNCRISGTPTTVSAATNYTVTATNSGGSTNATVNITVNDAAPTTLAFAGGPFTFTKSVAITSLTSTSSGGAITSCSGTLPTGLSVALTTGNCVISGTPTAISAATNYTVTATNSGGSINATVNITVNDAAPTSLAFAGGPFVYTRSAAISSLTSTSSGGAITSCTGTLPAGLSVALTSGNCVISGTPTAASAASNYTVTASNSGGSSNATVNIAVNDIAPSSLAFAGGPFVYTKGTAITALTSTQSGGTITSCTGSLPTGLSVTLTSGNCVISGTPTVISAATDYTVTASNTGGTSSATVNIRVNDTAPSALNFSGTTYTFSVGTAVSQSGSASGGAIVSCSSAPTLPAGLSVALSGANCLISGTPTAYTASTSYTITATNSGGSTTRALTILVTDKPSLSYAGATGTSVAVSTALSVSPTTFSANGAALSSCGIKSGSANAAAFSSAGFSVNASTCAISGTPSSTMSATTFTLVATNSVGNSSDATVSLTVTAAACPSGTFNGGDGSVGNPYKVCHSNHFALINANSTSRSKAYVMTADISMSGVTYTPIADFTGVFDGASHVISSLTITSTDRCGLFATLMGATVKNLTLTSVSSTCSAASSFTGTLAGVVRSVSQISNVGVTSGSATSSNGTVGGLVGTLTQNSTLARSYSLANVNDSIYANAGGLVGSGDAFSITDSYARGTLTIASGRAAGLVGYVLDGYDENTPNGDEFGYTATAAPVLRRSYFAGSYGGGGVTGDPLMRLAAGVAGGAWSDNVFSSNTSGQSTSNYGTARTTAQMQTTNDSGYNNWDKSTVWRMTASQFPKLFWQP